MKRQAATALLFLAASFTVTAGAARGDAGPLRIGTSGDYAPFSLAVGEETVSFEGFDIELARAYTSDRGLAIEFVQFRWPDLTAALAANRFDIAMSGVTMRPERSAIGRFSVAVTETGAVVLGRPKDQFSELRDFDRQRVTIGVNAGGHLERVAREHFPNATLLAIANNEAVHTALMDGKLDAVVTDTLEAQHWRLDSDDLALIGPFTSDRKAYLVHRERPDLAADLDRWLLEREADGTLDALRSKYFGQQKPSRLATPLRALLIAIDERLSLMPLVGAAKRRTGLPLEIPERESIVLDAAIESAMVAAQRAGLAPPPIAAIRRLFQAQMAAAKQVQWESLRDPESRATVLELDLKTELRPALLRIGDRIGQLLAALPADLDGPRVREMARRELRTPYLSESTMLTIADAISELSSARKGQRNRVDSEPGGKP
jgi:cyclohexadienyl dehydratase